MTANVLMETSRVLDEAASAGIAVVGNDKRRIGHYPIPGNQNEDRFVERTLGLLFAKSVVHVAAARPS